MLDMVKAEIRQDLEQLTALDAVSGHEQAMVRAMRDRLGPLSDELNVDTFGNVRATLSGTGDGYHLMLAAHSDEIGLIVKSIEPNGYLRFSTAGGVQPGLLPARMVRVNGAVHGIIGVKSGHLLLPEERNRPVEPDRLYIDIGADSSAAVAELGVRIGDPVAFVSPLTELNHPGILAGKAIDDRLGCAVLLAVMRQLRRDPSRTKVSCVITTQEEVGLRGAAVAAYSVDPDCAVAIDTFMSGDTPDVDFHREMPAAIGKGPVLLVASGGDAHGNFIHAAMERLLEQAAADAKVPYQRATVLGKAATDASTIHLARGGIPTGGVGLARRYSHSPVCTCHLEDAANAVIWLLALVRTLDGRPSLAFLPD